MRFSHDLFGTARTTGRRLAPNAAEVRVQQSAHNFERPRQQVRWCVVVIALMLVATVMVVVGDWISHCEYAQDL
jgi:hypothetical protein